MKKSKIRVVSIFYSIQGEGSFVGRASIFIRLHGCNMSCSFCDDELHKGKFESLDFNEILGRISGFNTNSVIITGGEPSIYNLGSFIKFLKSKNYFVAVETNGFNFENIRDADWITYSPKDLNHIERDGFDELKFVVDRESCLDKILSIKSDKPIYIQPKNYHRKPNMENVRYCSEVVLKYPHLKLSVQLHKFLDMD